MDELGNTIDFAEIAAGLWNKMTHQGRYMQIIQGSQPMLQNNAFPTPKLLFAKRKMSALMASRWWLNWGVITYVNKAQIMASQQYITSVLISGWERSLCAAMYLTAAHTKAQGL